MGSRKKYFPQHTDSPAPLVAATTRRVRFEEVDALGMVWHGRYPSYFEDGRIAFGDRYGLSYQSFIEHQTVAPIVQMHFDYHLPLRFDEHFSIVTTLHWSDALRLNFTYLLCNQADKTIAEGYTVQLLTEPSGNLLFFAPRWLEEFREKWKNGSWS
jgi:acyl-CoA thioester hydrolase